MADSSTDILMAVVGKEGRLSSDDRVVFASRTKAGGLLDGFVEDYVFELREFDFSIGAADSLKAAKAEQQVAAAAAYAAKLPAEGPAPPNAPPFAVMPESRPGAAKAPPQAPDMQPIEYTRIMDSASTALFTALTTCETLTSIAIVKRKAAGTVNGGEPYLRLDFTDVLITGLEWKENNDVVEETGTFIYRQIKLRYRPQAADGTLGNPIQYQWKMVA